MVAMVADVGFLKVINRVVKWYCLPAPRGGAIVGYPSVVRSAPRWLATDGQLSHEPKFRALGNKHG